MTSVGLRELREEVLHWTVRATLVLGAATAVVAVVDNVGEGARGYAAFYALLYVAAATIVTTWKQFHVRAILLEGVLYALAIAELLRYGFDSLAFPVFIVVVVYAGLFFGLRGGAVALVISVVPAWAVIGMMYWTGSDPWAQASETAPAAWDDWVASALVHTFLSVGVFLAVGVVLRGLEAGRVANERLAGSLAAENERRRVAEAALERRAKFQELIVLLSTKLLVADPAEYDKSMVAALEEIGRFVEADRVYIYEYTPDFGAADLLHQWNREGERPSGALYPKLPASAFPAFDKILRANGKLIVNSIAGLEDAYASERSSLADSDTKSMMSMPLVQAGVVFGFVGLSSASREREWKPEEIGPFSLAAEFFANHIHKTRAQLEAAQYRGHLEEKLAERAKALEEANQELLRRQRLAAVGQLVATVSHELRNPLGTIRGSVYILEQTVDRKDERAVRALERTNRALDRSEHIIDELLDYSRPRELQLEPTEVDGHIRDILSDYDTPAAVTIECSLETNATVPMDRERIRQCLINLLNNAAEAMFETQGSGRPCRIKVSTRSENGEVRVLIEDSGPGIPEELRDKVFEPLFTTKSIGVGLGLPLVKQVMEQHGGGVRIHESSPNGTVMLLWLPVAGVDQGATGA